MADSEPQEPKPPFTPDPNKRLFGGRRAKSRITSPDSKYDPEHGYLPKPGEKKDPMVEFHDTAKRFADMEEEIAQLARAYEPKDGDHTGEKYFKVDIMEDGRIDDVCLEPAPFGDEDGSTIHFRTLDPEFDYGAPKGTKYAIEIEFSMVDQELGRTVIEKGLEVSSSTRFYFKDNGTYVKAGVTSSLAPEPTNKKAKLIHEYYSQKTYILPMEADDFELAGAALMALMKELRPEKKPQE